MRTYDISIPLRLGMAGWPGDAAYEMHWTCRKAAGATVNLSEVRMSVHCGTHCDAPFHFADDGKTIESLDLTPYFGRARVIDVRGRALIHSQDLGTSDLSSTPRILLRTDSWTDATRFPEKIPVMAPELPSWLAQRGVILIGVDVPSVDALDSKDLPNHHALGSANIAILESVTLVEVPAGVYELFALPLKLVGADGAPVRAVLREVAE
jgi:arylformamidase